MIIRLVITVFVVFLMIKLFRHVFLEKACDTCGKRIAKEAEVCRHCNTIQQKPDS